MCTLSEWMEQYREREQAYDFPGMATCLNSSKEELFAESPQSEAGSFFLEHFFNTFVWCAFSALEKNQGEVALSYLETAEEIVDRVYGKRQMLLVCYKGYAYQHLGMYAEAEQCFLEYLAHEPQDETVFFRLGNVAAHQQQWNKALEAYDHALRIKKNYREAMLNIGIIARWLGDKETAEAMALDEELRQRIFNDSELEEDPGRYSLAMNPDDYRQIPIFINSRDRLSFLRQQIDWLLVAGYSNIYILDNDSTYPPLLEYYKDIEEKVNVIYLKKNLGYKALWKSGILNVLNIQTPYAYTDPDIVPVEECPHDVLKKMVMILRQYPYIKKVGFGLKTDDITFEGRAEALAHEKPRMTTLVEDELYFGVIDTTFALYRNYRHYNAYATLRLAGDCMARHLPWYMDYKKMSEEEAYYARHATNDYSTWMVLKNNGKVERKTFTSIIILSYNALEYTQLCIESIRKHTRPGTYEIIVIDNASTDGSVQWLKEQKDIRLIRNDENVGFPKGCNQGLKIAQGTELLLLNNDTIVTPRWLDNMLAALYSQSNVGAVSCLTNHCSNEQSISDVEYDSLEGLEEAAGEFNHPNSDKWYPWLLLVGFCMMFKRDVYERIGGLDEAFSPGNFEDDDYCLRMRQAGYELLLCGDTYIHHFGSVAFSGKNTPEQQREKERKYQELITRNRAYFLQKWKVTEAYHMSDEMITSMADEIEQGRDVLIVNCDLAYNLFWLRRRNANLQLFGLTNSEIGMQVAGKTFPIFVCRDFKQGLRKHFTEKKFDRIVLLGNARIMPDGEKLIHTLRSSLTEEGLLYFGDAEHVYRMPAKDMDNN
ncbi:glycosyltransferase [uncultured Anaerovibrio sp.]|uniref:glycosyltransferase n=1 Tax=uncultured Anaerovibrio sp. TaxID=361586 RepID=UPI002608DC3B|nr:glycosyltransferase [uncultured Anaerovibrio sp.]